MIKNGLINGAESIYKIAKNKSERSTNSELLNQCLFTMAKTLIEKAKTIKILTDQEQFESLGVIVRSFIELRVSFKYIIEADSEKRAKSYFYDYREQVFSMMKTMGNLDASYKEIPKKAMQQFFEEVPSVSDFEEAVQYYKNLRDDLYDNPKQHSQKWYNLQSKKRSYNGFKGLMIDLKFGEDMYEFFYGLGSLDAHGNGTLGNLGNEDQYYSSIPISVGHTIVEVYLCEAFKELVKFYGASRNSRVELSLKQMENSVRPK